MLSAAAWLAVALCALGLGLVGTDALVVGAPLALLSLIACWRYYRSRLVIVGDELTIHRALPGAQSARRESVELIDEAAGGLTTRPVLVMHDGSRVTLHPAAEFTGPRVSSTRKALSHWLDRT